MLDEQIAAPSAVAVEPVEVEELNDEQHSTWIKTGELPARSIPDATGDSSTPKPAGDASLEDGAGKKAESGTAKQASRKGGDNRKQELGAEIKELLEKRGVLKEEDFWKEFEDFRNGKKGAGEASAGKESPTVPTEVKEPSAPERPKRPRRADFSTDDAYEGALDKYDDEMLAYVPKKSAYDAVKLQVDAAKKDVEVYNKKIEETWKARVVESQGKHEDFNEIAFAKDLPIPWGSPVDEWVLQSEVGAEMLYFLGKNRDELKRINALGRPAQHRELAKLEEKLSGTAEVKEKPKAKTVSDALPPPREVGGKATVAVDEEEAALKDGDVDRYIELANKRDLAQRRRGK